MSEVAAAARQQRGRYAPPGNKHLIPMLDRTAPRRAGSSAWAGPGPDPEQCRPALQANGIGSRPKFRWGRSRHDRLK